MYEQIKQIETIIGNALRQELNVIVEITNRDATTWTISGADADARKAAGWLNNKGLMEFESEPVHDEELEETFCYMRNAASVSALRVTSP